MENKQLIEKFYSAFRDRDYKTMAECYHLEIEFQDPVFKLKGPQVAAMWHMLVSRGKDTKISFHSISADENTGRCSWEANYSFGPKKRSVHNIIESQFTFKDGKIFRQQDQFDLWRWAGMAMGPLGKLLGWSQWLKSKIQTNAKAQLDLFIEANPQYKP